MKLVANVFSVYGGHVVKNNFSSTIGVVVVKNEMPTLFRNNLFFLFLFSYEGVIIQTCTISSHNHCLIF
jgi:hypothetical protein